MGSLLGATLGTAIIRFLLPRYTRVVFVKGLRSPGLLATVQQSEGATRNSALVDIDSPVIPVLE